MIETEIVMTDAMIAAGMTARMNDNDIQWESLDPDGKKREPHNCPTYSDVKRAQVMAIYRAMRKLEPTQKIGVQNYDYN